MINMADRHLNPKKYCCVKVLTLIDYNLAQIECINEHKWYLSEEVGYEITFNEAAIDWSNSGLAAEFRKFHIIKS